MSSTDKEKQHKAERVCGESSSVSSKWKAAPLGECEEGDDTDEQENESLLSLFISVLPLPSSLLLDLTFSYSFASIVHGKI